MHETDFRIKMTALFDAGQELNSHAEQAIYQLDDRLLQLMSYPMDSSEYKELASSVYETFSDVFNYISLGIYQVEQEAKALEPPAHLAKHRAGLLGLCGIVWSTAQETTRALDLIKTGEIEAAVKITKEVAKDVTRTIKELEAKHLG